MRKYLLLLLVFCACSKKEKIPKDILSPEKMENVLWDVVSAAEFHNAFIARRDSTFNKDSAQLDAFSRVFHIHKIKLDDFEKSYAWYQAHPDFMSVVLDSLSKRASPEFIRREKIPLKDSLKRRQTIPEEVIEIK